MSAKNFLVSFVLIISLLFCNYRYIYSEDTQSQKQQEKDSSKSSDISPAFLLSLLAGISMLRGNDPASEGVLSALKPAIILNLAATGSNTKENGVKSEDNISALISLYGSPSSILSGITSLELIIDFNDLAKYLGFDKELPKGAELIKLLIPFLITYGLAKSGILDITPTIVLMLTLPFLSVNLDLSGLFESLFGSGGSGKNLSQYLLLLLLLMPFISKIF